MARLLSNLSIDQLEKLFDERRNNPDVAQSIAAELSHRRQTRRVKNLRARAVQAIAVAPKPRDTEEHPEVSGQTAGGRQGPLPSLWSWLLRLIRRLFGKP
jgi:hypothetical protein